MRDISMGNLDVLIVSDNCLDTVGGEQESVKIIIKGTKDKYSLGIIQPGKVSRRESGVRYFCLTEYKRMKHLIKNPVAFILYIYKVMRIINANKPKIIHTQAQVSFFIVALLKKLRLISHKTLLIHTDRGLYLKYGTFIRNMFVYFMKKLHMLVTTTEFNMNHWKKALTDKGISIEYRVIENTAGELFETYDESLHKHFDDQLVVGFAGRYTDWKNWPLSVEIAEKLNELIGDKLHIKMAVGCLDEKSLQKAKSMFAKLSKMLGSRFEGKINISIEEMDRFYYDIDIFVLTSKKNTESFGRTIIEAMSRKTVVLTTDAGGPAEVLGNKNNICTTADEFAEKILEYFRDKEMMNNEKEENFIRVRQLYSFENNINKHLNLYAESIKLPGRMVYEYTSY